VSLARKLAGLGLAGLGLAGLGLAGLGLEELRAKMADALDELTVTELGAGGLGRPSAQPISAAGGVSADAAGGAGPPTLTGVSADALRAGRLSSAGAIDPGSEPADTTTLAVTLGGAGGLPAAATGAAKGRGAALPAAPAGCTGARGASEARRPPSLPGCAAGAALETELELDAAGAPE
jgi:hypothetical protein